MNSKRCVALTTCLALALIAAGCGAESNNAGPSLSQQYLQASKVEDPEARAKQLVRVAYAQHKSSDFPGAVNSLAEAASAASQIEAASNRAATTVTVAFAYATIDEKDEARRLLNRVARTVEEIEETFQKISPLCSLAIAYGVYLERGSTADEKLSEAEELIPSIEHPVNSADAWRRLAYTRNRLKDQELAEQALQKALQGARDLADTRERADALATLAKTLHDMQHDDVDSLFAEALKTIEELDTPLNRGYALVHLAEQTRNAERAQEASEHLAAARRSAEQVQDAGLRKPLLQAIDNQRR